MPRTDGLVPSRTQKLPLAVYKNPRVDLQGSPHFILNHKFYPGKDMGLNFIFININSSKKKKVLLKSNSYL